MSDQELINEGYIEGKKSFDYLSKQIHEDFNWSNIHKAMIATDWCWSLGKDSLGNDNLGVPNIQTIKNHAFSLLKEVYECGKHSSTGGFSAGWDNGELYLTFTLEECSA